jgi:hypothetical protein
MWEAETVNSGIAQLDQDPEVSRLVEDLTKVLGSVHSAPRPQQTQA